MGATVSSFFGGDAANAPKRLRRAIHSVEDLFPPEMFFRTVANGYLEPHEMGSAVVNRQFKKTCYNPRVLTGRGVIALIGQDCSPSVPEAKKWFTITAELHGTREALIFLGAMAYGGTTPLMKMFVRSKDVNLVEAERLFRAAVAADASPSESYCLFAPAEHGLDIARVDLAALLQSKGGDNALDEAASLLASVLAHDAIPSTQENQLRRPNSEARALKADMIRQEQAPGTLAEALELVEAIPEADRDGLEGSNCEYMLGAIYKALDEEAPNDEHARKAFEHINRAMGEGHPRASFDMGQLAENGRGTPVHLLTAYTAYWMAAMGPKDPRAIAHLNGLLANPPCLPELILACGSVRQINAAAGDVVAGNATFAEAMQTMDDPALILAAFGIEQPGGWAQ